MGHNFKFDVDVNVINHLGVGLYSSTPAALTELVANAWDADATEVTIDINPTAESIVIQDDGHGMTPTEIQKRFLNVGFSRRGPKGTDAKSASGKRQVMGRKGIGKLSMFALADTLMISSQTAKTSPVGFTIDVPAFKKALAEHTSSALPEFVPKSLPQGHGTRIEMKNVLKGLQTTESYLRVKLARRFSIIGGTGFKLKLNGSDVTKADRGFYNAVQFLWTFDDASLKEIYPLCVNLASLPTKPKPKQTVVPCTELLPNQVTVGKQIFSVSGYIASVAQPKQLGTKDDSANIVSVFANGRVFAEDILHEANSAKYYQNYLVGEIHANFLDSDSVDRATASREAIKKDDPTYQALISLVRSSLDEISNKWDTWRTALGLDESEPENVTILEWIDTLPDERDKKAATRLMTSIKNATVHADGKKNAEAQAVLYRGAIVGFERLRLRNQLAQLDALTDVLSPEFAAIFAGLDSLEETAYAEITQQRLKIVEKFASIANNLSTLEKVAQQYLFKNLWLLDPSWDRVTGRAEMEVTLTKYIKQVVPDSTGARLDISYRASSSKHVVVELKKPSLSNLKYDTLFAQVRKYKKAVEQYYKTHEPEKPIPALDIYVLVAKAPAGYEESDRRALAEVSGRIITYSQLISDAKNAYQEYLDEKAKVSKLGLLLKKLGE
jgi:Histidine kinase-, DNA gyrase B-, and HSP90-like ATPase